MEDYEVVYEKIIKAESFFDAVERAKVDDVEILTVSRIPPEIDDVYD